MLEHKCDVKDTTDFLEISIEKIELLLIKDYGISKRAISLLLLQEDKEILELVKSVEPQIFSQITEIINCTKSSLATPLAIVTSL